ncbi:MAG: exosortase A [Betaproteobacteria bacterium]
MMHEPTQRLAFPGGDATWTVAGRSWQVASATLVVVLAWIVGWYWSTGATMVGIWARSDTFAHGFLVAPISLWLIFRKRSEIARIAAHPSWWVLVPIAGAGLAWLLGVLGAVNALSQISFVAMLVLAVPAVIGVPAARTIAFPLAFLFFAVPVGEFVMPQLMEWTADVTVKAIALTGIPVFREGQNFVIPSGRWSVVEACSGVRYLIASLVIGTLYSYLTYRSLTRRLVFVAFSIVVPIVANWARAYMIVMIGHLSGNRLAVGVDHLIYGWAFFGIVILLMFWIGGFWRDDEVAQVAGVAVPTQLTLATSPSWFVLVAAMIAIATAAWPLGERALQSIDAASSPALPALAATGAWKSSAGPLSDWQPHFQNPSAEIHQAFDRGDARVGVYIAYYRNQNSGRKVVSSENVLVLSKDDPWSRIASGIRRIDVDGQTVDARTAELKARADERLVLWQWYWIDGRLTASDALAKAYTALSRLMGHGDDGAIVIVYSPNEQPGAANAALDDFMRDVGPSLAAELRRTAGLR